MKYLLPSKRIFLIFAATLAALVACNNKFPVSPNKQITLTANVDFGQGSTSPDSRVAPDTPIPTTDNATVNFHWEEGDQVIITDGTTFSTFTIVDNSIQGTSASFTGTALDDMSSYYAFYAGKNISNEFVAHLLNADPIELSNVTGGYNVIVASEDGNENGFTMNEFFNTLGLSLSGHDIKLGSVKYYCAGADVANPSTTINFGTDGLTLTTTPQEVWLPINATNSGFTLRFFDTNGVQIMEKSKSMDWTGYGDFNELVTFPSLDVKGYIKLFLEDGTTEANTIGTTDYLSHCDEGTTLQLVAKFFPEDIIATNVTWSSDREDILTVSTAGLLTKMCGDVSGWSGNPTCYITCEANDDSRYPATMQAATCFAAGTCITMADGSVKKVEDIVEGDLIRTFDHEAGCISSAKVCLTYKGETKIQSLDLTFASGRRLSIVGTHDLLLENTRKYVRVNSGNVASFVGKRFYNAGSGKWDSLVSFETGAPVDYYCIYSAKYLNCIAQDFLTCPDDVDHILNIYELDAKLKANASQLSADIAQYGLFDLAREYPEFAQYNGAIEDLGGKYVYIAIGKGLVPGNHIEQMKSYWSGK